MKHRKNKTTDDLVKIGDMLSAMKEIFSFIKEKKRSDLDKDRMLALSLIKEIEIIGEAADQISNTFKEKNDQIPWRDIIDMRNRLIHGYCDIDYDVVWDTITYNLKPLMYLLRRLIS